MFKIDSITLDSNWAKIPDPDSNSICLDPQHRFCVYNYYCLFISEEPVEHDVAGAGQRADAALHSAGGQPPHGYDQHFFSSFFTVQINLLGIFHSIFFIGSQGKQIIL